MGHTKPPLDATQGPPARSWLRFGLLPPEEKLDVAHAKPYLELKIAALRSDGRWFFSSIFVDKENATKTDGFSGAMGAIQAMSDALKHLESFKDCSCLPDVNIVCKKHEKKEAS